MLAVFWVKGFLFLENRKNAVFNNELLLVFKYVQGLCARLVYLPRFRRMMKTTYTPVPPAQVIMHIKHLLNIIVLTCEFGGYVISCV